MNRISVKERPYDAEVRRILDTFAQGFEGAWAKAVRIVEDVRRLYEGVWPAYEPCQVRYHTFGHVADVALATARMMVGWNLSPERERLSDADALAGLVAALFHDAGYLKEKGDRQGSGGKLAFRHVARSQEMAGRYLDELGWEGGRRDLVVAAIGETEFSRPPELKGLLGAFPGNAVGGIVATADLVAQMADPYYMERLVDLYDEFAEAYDHEGREALRARGFHVFASAKEIYDGTLVFFERFVVPRLDALGQVYRCLGDFFGGERNPYIESIATNLYGSTAVSLSPRQRIGELLVDLGLISEQVLVRALEEQQALEEKRGLPPHDATSDGLGALIEWIDLQSGRHYLGDLLVRMGEVDGDALSRVLTDQLLPRQLEEKISPGDMASLLRIGLVLGSVRHMPHVYGQVLQMLVDLVESQAGSVLLADERSGTLVIIKAVGPRGNEVQGMSLPWDKGVAGWAYANKRAAAVNHTHYDNRFFADMDARSGFVTRSILAVPLMLGDRVIGVLEALNKTSDSGVFDERDLIIMSVVAQQLAGSLDAFLWMMENGQLPPQGEE